MSLVSAIMMLIVLAQDLTVRWPSFIGKKKTGQEGENTSIYIGH